jgi:hypothetical protein
MPDVKIVNAALDDFGDSIVLRGVVEPASLCNLLTPGYQREVLPQHVIGALCVAIKAGERMPDIELGMRGQKYTALKGESFVLHDPAYIIDGLQRVTAARALIGADSQHPRLGVVVHFSTSEAWERERFKALNTKRVKLSPNVLLRNMRPTHSVIESLYGICQEKSSFPLGDRVCWAQNMRRADIVTALTFVKVVAMLHTGFAPGRENSLDAVVEALMRQQDVVGRSQFRDNVRAFFGYVDAWWGIRSITHQSRAVHLTGGALLTLARIFADHTDFWRGGKASELFVMAPLARKLASFDWEDDNIMRLTASGGAASRALLYSTVVKYVNSGKRHRKLTERRPEYRGARPKAKPTAPAKPAPAHAGTAH